MEQGTSFWDQHYNKNKKFGLNLFYCIHQNLNIWYLILLLSIIFVRFKENVKQGEQSPNPNTQIIYFAKRRTFQFHTEAWCPMIMRSRVGILPFQCEWLLRHPSLRLTPWENQLCIIHLHSGKIPKITQHQIENRLYI